MSTSKFFDRICIAVLILAIVITVMFMNGQAFGLTMMTDPDAERFENDSEFSDREMLSDPDTSSATSVVLEGENGTVSGNGAYFLNGSLTIVTEGTYVIRGQLTDGSIIIDCKKNEKVTLVFDGVDVYCEDSAALYVKKADKVFLNLAENSTNTLTSGEQFSEKAEDKNINGVITTNDDFVINGTGSLTIVGGSKHGISVGDDLCITGGTITVTASSDAIHVQDCVKIGGGLLILSAGDDAIHADDTIRIYSGSMRIISCYEGLEAECVEIFGGNMKIAAVDDGINAKQNNAGDADGTASVLISGGTLTIINESGENADGIDSNGDIVITGGVIAIFLNASPKNCALDYGIENGGSLLIDGGIVLAAAENEGQGVNADSEQVSLAITLSQAIEAGTTIQVMDEEGHLLIDTEALTGFSTLLISCPEFNKISSCTVVIGNLTKEISLITKAGTYEFEAMGG